MYHARLYMVEPRVLRTQFVAHIATVPNFDFRQDGAIFDLSMASGESIEQVLKTCARSHVNEFGPWRIYKRRLEFLTRMHFKKEDLPQELQAEVPDVFSTLDDYLVVPEDAVQQWREMVVTTIKVDEGMVELDLDREALHFEYKGVGFTFYSPFAFSLLNSATRKVGA